MSVWADGGTLNVIVTDRTGYEVATTDDDAIVEYVGDDHTTFDSAGTGVINSFLQTQDTPSEQGYNTNGPKEFDTGSSPTFNRAILMSEIPVLECESLDGLETTAGLCWELWADINDSNANDPDAAQIQLTDLEIWLTDDPNITGYDQGGTGFGADADKVYDFSGTVLINDVNQGSGRGDLRYLVPIEGMTLPGNCQYGSTTCTTYFVVYTEWGDTEGGDFISDSGFEEWTVKKYPFVSVTKTAVETFTRTYTWTIDKSVTPDAWALFDGESGTSRYTIAVDKTGFTDSNWAVSGNITITNTSEEDAVVTSVTDSISGVGPVTVSCPGGLPAELDPDDSLVCTYSSSLPDGSTRTNTASATLSDGPAFTDDEQILFGAPTTEVNGTIHVVDNNLALPGEPVAFSDDGSVNVEKTFDCSSLTIADGGSGSYTFNNIATIQETGQTDNESVDVTCYRLDVEKTVNESRTRTWNWTIDKSVTPDNWALFDGESGTSQYTITVNKVDFTDSAWTVSGNITISNPHPTRTATINSVTDVISATGLTDVNATVGACSGDATAPYTVPAAGNIVCSYTATLNSGADRTNTATATQQLYDFDWADPPVADGTEAYSDAEDVDFDGATTTEVNASITVVDNNLALPGEPVPFSDDGSVTVEKTFDCSSLELTDGSSDSYSFTNIATIVETNQTDNEQVDVTCYRLDVEKTAVETFTRTWTWTIDKSSPTTALTMMVGQSIIVNYSVQVNATSADSAWAVSGVITITNPHPTRDATINSVTDVITLLNAADVNATVSDCDGDTTAPFTVPAGESIDCDYSSALPTGDDRTNTATATQQLYDFDWADPPVATGTEDYTDQEAVDFGDPTSVIDECVTVTDTYAGTLGTACAGVDTLPKTFTYQRTVGPVTADQCGGFTVDNTATFTTNDTATTGSDSVSIPVTVDCPEGCTLTQGYWKTHNESFHGGAPADPNWFLLGADGEETLFFNTGDTWFEVFWTAPAGRPYYVLAHQYMAAYLNKLSIEDIGGTIPTAVQDALDDAAILLANNSYVDLKGKNAKAIRAQMTALAGILGDFNEGTTGPGHCDEDFTSDLTLAASGAPVFLAPIGLLAPIAARLRRRLAR